MIRNAVLHLANEQPLLADLFAPPTASDMSLVCTNLRTMNGQRPVFVDHADSLFVFPYTHVRFVEVSAESLAAAGPRLGAGHGATDGNGTADDGPGRADDPAVVLAAAARERADAQARAAGDGSTPPDATAETDGTAPGEPADDLSEDLELDEDFLRRVREI